MKASSTHTCLCFMLKFAQCFGMLPVCGITDENHTSLSFRWTSKRTLYSLLFLALSTLNTILQFLKMITWRMLNFGQFVTLLFFFVTAVTVAIFLQVAMKWPHLMKKWAEVELALAPSYEFPPTLNKRLKTISFIIMSAAIVEHSLFISFMIKYSRKGESLSENIQLYFEHSFDQVFNFLSFCVPLGIIVQMFNFFSTLSWNFMDLFIMLISLCLSERFKQVVKRINMMAKNMERDVNLWGSVREDYTKLTNLCATVDDTISNIILVSFANNIFIVLVQLYFSLQRPPSNGILDKVYYVYSFAFLIIRTIAVVLYASTINLESKKPRYYLNILPQSVYNVEIERFLCLTKYITVALTGRKLFKVTKSLILSVAGAIVSYELVLIQLIQ